MSDPSILRPEVTAMRQRSAVCRALLGGTTAMRNEGTTYLPQEPGESDEAYRSRLNKTVLFPAFEDSLDAMVGKPLGEPIVANVASEIEAHLENVDLAGRDLDTWARSVFVDGLVDGITWAIIDAPKTTPGMTLAQERAQNVRPYWVHVPLSRVLGWRSSLVNGKHALTQFRIMESVEVEDGPYATKAVEQIRVWKRLVSGVELEVWQKLASGWTLDAELSGPVSCKEIPVACYAPGRTGFFSAIPPLESLAWLNVAHWQSSSDQRHVLHVARVPQLSADEDARDDKGAPVSIGPNRLTVGLKNLRFVEHSGKAIESGRTDLLDLVDQMRVVAGRMLARPTGTEKSATESGLESREGGSKLRQWTWSFQDFIEECLRLHAAWMGQNQGGRVTINTEWDELLDPATFATALQARISGNLSKKTFLRTAQAAGVPVEDVEAEITELDTEGPELLAPLPTKRPA